ncbi:hypothetical protein A3J17_03205 [Candidatus Curtissbacteria bacterium RIFCSPLOWO2_02_FULL_40_11]|uniref:Uncharacterized protein n=2 Tax=Candidatus Curtissiibacteriota TaxID=1752717 RepID=A0A1F5G6R7_9BACT|nr:MAG: hypothetical protein A3D04_04625 [Candidatus Curtissbacteria bacterium RIFCSPHIGHO2_02_FULL_40_16b]OGE00909.1 MAG: hypothetical protein A3J17_03205 [Candidatus Curtissbacteria bacterium RIFCSPLOWO2_02_FULL_40_11]OGE14228.1 MAG: hypothetical protein A3G14_04250 [Candidatus Curtissbacteria bacterium RIFCSPLOWO2_12_FULL_38_9]
MNYDDQDSNEEENPEKPPSVTGEEDPFSGDATSSESPDIDEELKKVGLHGDEQGAKELDVDEEL